MKKLNVIGFIVVSALSLATASQAAESSSFKKEKVGENAMKATNEVQVEASVTSVNKKTREIVLRSDSGEEVAMIAGDEIKNFDQIKKGDRLKVRYFESLVLTLKKGGKAPLAENTTSDVQRAQPGQKPSINATETQTATGTITKVDKKRQTVMVQGPNRSVELHVQQKDIFDKLKKGDQIEATYNEALAISVETVKK